MRLLFSFPGSEEGSNPATHSAVTRWMFVELGPDTVDIPDQPVLRQDVAAVRSSAGGPGRVAGDRKHRG